MDIRWSNWAIYIEIIIAIWFIESSGNTTTLFECGRERNKGCCDGYYRDTEGNNCINFVGHKNKGKHELKINYFEECERGYTGPNCSIQCPYPTYGDACQGICHCDNDTCHISTGCRIPTKDELTLFSLTLEPTNVYNYTEFYTVELTSSTVSETPSTTRSIINGSNVDGFVILQNMDIRWAIYIEIIIPIWIIESSGNTKTPLECESERNEGCCDGYYRDPEGNSCTKCGPGYFGPNCTIQCHYPSYGDECQGICDCDNETCDISTGCTFLTTDKFTSLLLTLEPTNVYNNTTFYTLEFSSSTVSDTTNDTTSFTDNGILITLIKIFGGFDILLIFIYTVIFVIDRQREKRANQTENTVSYTTRNNSMYENVAIDFST